MNFVCRLLFSVIFACFFYRLHEDLGDVCVIVTSSTGEVIYNEKVQTSTMPYLVIPLKVRDQEKGVLHIMNDYNHVFGDF